MNNVSLIGRLTKDVTASYTADGMAVARFSIAIDRGKDKQGNDRGADFPSVVCFGKSAENMEKYTAKGRLIGVSGRIQTGSYEKDGRKTYTTDIIADRVEFLDWGDGTVKETKTGNVKPSESDIPSGFTMSDDDIPF